VLGELGHCLPAKEIWWPRPLVEKRLLVVHHFSICVAHMGCATHKLLLVAWHWWRISLCATHSLKISGTYSICAISILCVAHIAICATNKQCATRNLQYAPLIFRTGPKKTDIFWYLYTAMHKNIQYNCRIHSMQYKTNISSSQKIRTIIVTKFSNIRSVRAYIAQVHALHTLHITHTTHLTKRPSRLHPQW
jgi:hypothetical protein